MSEVIRLNVQDVDSSVVTAYRAKSGGVVVGVYENINKAAKYLGVSRRVLLSRIQDKASVEAPAINEVVSCRLTKRTADMKFRHGLLITPPVMAQAA